MKEESGVFYCTSDKVGSTPGCSSPSINVNINKKYCITITGFSKKPNAYLWIADTSQRD